MVFQQPELELYQRLVEASRNRLAKLELELEHAMVSKIGEKSPHSEAVSRLYTAAHHNLWKGE